MQQQAMSAVEPFAQNMIRKAASLILKQAADIARTDARAGGYASNVEARNAHLRRTIGFDRPQPSGLHTSLLEYPIVGCHRGDAADEVADMRGKDRRCCAPSGVTAPATPTETAGEQTNQG